MHKILIYLQIIHLLKSSTCFEHCAAHLQEVYVIIVYMQPLVSSLSAGDCPVHRLREKFFLNRCTGQSPAESDDIRGCIYTGDCPVHWLRKKKEFFLNRCTGQSPRESDDTRGCIYTSDSPVHWLRKKKEFFLNQCTGQSPAESDNTRGCIYTITT